MEGKWKVLEVYFEMFGVLATSGRVEKCLLSAAASLAGSLVNKYFIVRILSQINNFFIFVNVAIWKERSTRFPGRFYSYTYKYNITHVVAGVSNIIHSNKIKKQFKIYRKTS